MKYVRGLSTFEAQRALSDPDPRARRARAALGRAALVLCTSGALALGCGHSGDDHSLGGTISSDGKGGADGMGGAGNVGGAGGMGGAGGAGGAGAMGGVGGGGNADTGADLIHVGDPDKILLRGTIVMLDQGPDVLVGEVLIHGTTIQCVAASCSNDPDYAAASIVETNGVILPGLIDAHNHVLFNVFDDDDWTPKMSYADHKAWADDLQDIVDAKQWLNGEVYKNNKKSPVDVGCEVGKYAELKAVIAGTTSVLGHIGLKGGDPCFSSLARTLSDSADDLSLPDKIQVSVLTPPSDSTVNSVCSNFADNDTNTFVLHLGEGIEGSGAASEWEKLKASPKVPTNGNMIGCLNVANTTLVHANAFNADQLGEIAAAGMSIIASVHVQVSLYGQGIDTSVTTKIALAREGGINVGIGPDWSIGGSVNMLDELRWVEKVDAEQWNALSPKDVVGMATRGSAKALRLDPYIGSIAVGKLADLAVIRGDTTDPYKAILDATPDEVVLTIVNGVPLYGDTNLAALGPAIPGCEMIEVCSGSKFACVGEAGGTPANKLGQTYPEIKAAIEGGFMQSLPEDGYQSYLPLAPLVRCGN